MIDKQTRVRLLQKSIARFERQLASLNRRSDSYSWLRLWIFLGGVIASLIIYFTIGTWPAAVLLVVTLAAFIVVVVVSRRIKDSATRYKLWIAIKTRHIARIELDWPKIPRPPASTVTPQHPFGVDLDLIGSRSIMHLLNTAISFEGSLRLQDWLLATVPNGEQTLARQSLVRELAPLVRFRDKLSLNAMLSARQDSQQNVLLQWLREDDPVSAASLHPMLIGFTIFVIVNALLWLGNIAGILPPLWQISVVIYLALYAALVRRVGDVFETAAVMADELYRLRAVFHQLETYPYQDGAVKRIVAPFLDPASRPSTKLRRLGWLMSAASIRGNALVWFLLNSVVPWDLYVAYFFKRIKIEFAALLPRWLDVWFELEAVGSLANFAYLNPEYTFPELLPDGMVLHGQALGHPLIPFDQKVCNDFSIQSLGEVDILTGSNMSGKSSFLRTLGVNLCLAYAGAPVNAVALTVSPFRLFTCIKVSDSVTDGISYFYAEVKRLKALLDALNQPDDVPLFFLIDEIFRGTNNRERLIGSRAYIEALVGQHGVGLIATHDLELIKLADDTPQIVNYHFEELIVGKKMIFDYKLRPGPSPTTNALKIMALEGLPVPAE